MKIKFLSLFLALTIYSNIAFSQSLPCGITPTDISSLTPAAITKCLVCTSLDTGLAAVPAGEVPLEIINCCAAPCKTNINDPALNTVQNCVATLDAFVSDATNKTKWPDAYSKVEPVVSKLKGLTGLCNLACTSASSKILDTCKYEPVHDACGAVCCNLSLGFGSVTNCVAEGTPSTCDGYKGTACPPPPPATASAKKGVPSGKRPLGGKW